MKRRTSEEITDFLEREASREYWARQHRVRAQMGYDMPYLINLDEHKYVVFESVPDKDGRVTMSVHWLQAFCLSPQHRPIRFMNTRIWCRGQIMKTDPKSLDSKWKRVAGEPWRGFEHE